jgi:hypothetical protein
MGVARQFSLYRNLSKISHHVPEADLPATRSNPRMARLLSGLFPSRVIRQKIQSLHRFFDVTTKLTCGPAATNNNSRETSLQLHAAPGSATKSLSGWRQRADYQRLAKCCSPGLCDLG